MTRPNVILFIADQLRADHLGCYGNPTVQTPHIDSLARVGTRFDRFYAASTVCMPNRATLMTGRMPSVHGVRRNGIPLSLGERTFVQQLRDEGYQTALIGKAHFQHYGMFAHDEKARKPESRTYLDHRELYENEMIERWRNDPGHDVIRPYYGFDHVDLCLYHGDMIEGHYARWLQKTAPDVYALRGVEAATADLRYQCRDAWRTQVPPELYSSNYIAEQTVTWIEEHRRTKGDQPFFLMCSFPDPHHPLSPPGQYWDMYDPESIDLPHTFHHRSRSPLIDYVHEASRKNPRFSNSHHPYAPEEREAREAIALTYGLISNMDAAVGKVLGKLQEQAADSSTLVAFTSDHGDFMGDHGIMLKGPIHFQGLIRVPFIWADLQDQQGERVSQDISGTIDVARTVLAATGCTQYNGLQGRSLLPQADTANQAGDGVLIENESANLLFGRPGPYKLRTLMHGTYRLTFSNDRALCELYDLAADPHELQNLWDMPQARETQGELLERLLCKMSDCADESPMPLSGG